MGTEFDNRIVRKFLDENDISFYILGGKITIFYLGYQIKAFF